MDINVKQKNIIVRYSKVQKTIIKTRKTVVVRYSNQNKLVVDSSKKYINYQTCIHGRLKRCRSICNNCGHGKLKYNCAICSDCGHGKIKKKMRKM